MTSTDTEEVPAPAGSSGAPTPAEAAIRLEALTKTYPGADRPAVDHLDLAIPTGELVALVGPSGCGKTTTLKMINRLIEPTSGTVWLGGTDARTLPAHELRRGIGYVIQQAGLFPHRKVRDNIATVPRLLGWDKHLVNDRVDELADILGLDRDLLGRYPSALSGGQQQRVGVARALAADPPVLLMDEPYSAVDPIVRARLQDELIALQAAVHKTIVLVTHDIDEATASADEARTTMGEQGYDWVAVCDGDNRLQGWIGAADLDGAATLADLAPRPFAAVVTAATTLKAALDGIVTSRTRVAVAVDDDGRYPGMLTLYDPAQGGT